MTESADDDLRTRLSEVLQQGGSRGYSMNELLRKLGLTQLEKKRVRRALRELQTTGDAARGREKVFVPHRTTLDTVGIIKVHARGFAFLAPDEPVRMGAGVFDEVYIAPSDVGSACHGDKVRVGITGQSRRSPEGKVVEVLERATETIVGTYYANRRGGQVQPRDERYARPILVPRPEDSLNVNVGDFVVVKIDKWTRPPEPFLGHVTENLGHDNTPGIDITVIIRDSGVDPEFPEAALAEAEALPAAISDDEIRTRTDFRTIPCFTMDGATAKDFDDALAAERLEDGIIRLYVHIADVSHYVTPRSALDDEALERATSIYPIDRVVPMLPERISNNLCSLRPNEDRLVMSCVMDIDELGRVHDYSIHDGIIHSAKRLIYEQVQQLMDSQATPELIREIGALRPQFEILYELRKRLTEMRMRRGALDLDIPENVVVFNDEGLPTGIEQRPRLESHRVVEECMLIANEVVATHLFNLQMPGVYRVHEDPDLDRLRQLIPVLAHLNVKFPARNDITPEAIQIVLAKLQDTAVGPIARRLILRSMARARYTPENLGHYGLASTCYTHFTSPIRRYPDLLVHRLLREARRSGAPMAARYFPPKERGGAAGQGPVPVASARLATNLLTKERRQFWDENLPKWTNHCSDRERRAERIEQDAGRVKALEFMKQFLDEEFDGTIIAVQSWGVFVELRPLPVEGVVHVRKLEDDSYEYDESRMTLKGRRNGRVLKLGDDVQVAVANVTPASGEMELRLVSHRGTVPQGSSGHRTPTIDNRPPRARRPFYSRVSRRGKRK